MLRNNNINVKALAVLYIRVFSHHEDVFAWLLPKLSDNDLINAELTISEFTHRLFEEDNLNYEGIRLQRIPAKIQKAINQKI